MRYLGIDLKLDKAYYDIERDKRNEVNLYQLADYASRYEIAVKPIRTPTFGIIKNHIANGSCVVLQFEQPSGQPHIAALVPSVDDGVLFCDYPRKMAIVSKEALSDVLVSSRGMLILSRTPFPKSALQQISHSIVLWLFLFVISLGILLTVARCSVRKDRSKVM
jgi:hypothetical protein